MQSVSVRAPAKINLGLRVLNKRPDGYHEIVSLLQMVSLFDDIRLEEGRRGIQLETDRADLPGGEENLVYRAADLLAREAGRVPAVRIKLTKRVPMAAGLGGGSSDAAATLVGLNRLWNLQFPTEKLMGLAVKIGMDVPFFLLAPAALALGRGEILEEKPRPAPPLSVLLVHPGFPVATRWAYQALNLGLTRKHKHISIRKFLTGYPGTAELKNDLEKVTFSRYPVLKEIKKALRACGAIGALMSGSGPTLFGLFRDPEEAAAARQQFTDQKDVSVFLVRTLSTFPAEPF